ncbi:hypothetical protein GCM10011490_24410 [Pseudoclavibacter endophyticus]|uniref:hypothetical protein n=1 Tax=Pseudoclavibacter endophyticus TaxID=1778590 RepID=UPI0016662AD7|nr:hypothetical protein [Pseudoclavibacter endophyticus]GGA72745.1 hypothetical protein GCM10011490_24410 [Pseudoclavibacter endophyticus]
MATAVEIMAAHGQQNAAATVRASLEVSIPVWLGAAVIAKESNGRNVFGHDVGGAMRGAGEVTPAKYAEFRRLIAAGHTSNGVGPAQITWKGFFTQADREGVDLTDPLQNIRFGLRLLAGYLGGDFSDAGIRRAGTAYNGAQSYGDDLVRQAAVWRQRLAGADLTAADFLSALSDTQQQAVYRALVQEL